MLLQFQPHSTVQVAEHPSRDSELPSYSRIALYHPSARFHRPDYLDYSSIECSMCELVSAKRLGVTEYHCRICAVRLIPLDPLVI